MTATEETVDEAASDGWEIVSITPEPTESERAAIIAAVEAFRSALWPNLTTVAAPAPSPRWRYAGRPWSRRPRYGGWA